MQWFFVIAVLIATPPEDSQQGPLAAVPTGAGAVVMHMRLDDEAITPVAERFIRRALQEAHQAGAQCVVIELDTPGGLMDSTRSVVKDILGSRVPVIVYVSPSGARAASAGVFITLASHVAAMAPGTHIGAAHPVQVGGLPIAPPTTPERPSPENSQGEDGVASRPSAMEEKIVNDTQAWARALADLRGRNAQWAEQAVAESSSITADEALEQGVIDLIASDLKELLQKLDGQEVTLAGGHLVQLRTESAQLRTIEMWWGESLLSVISNPNVAFLLLMIGFYGVILEFYSPGWGVAGTLGAICLLLGFFGLSVLPVNYAGLALITVGLALLVAEAFFVSFGALTAGGIVCLVLGGLMLVDSPTGFMRLSLGVVAPLSLATAAITVFLMGSVVRAHRHRVVTGGEGMIGDAAIACEDFTPQDGQYIGKVRSHGELWKAVSAAAVPSDAPLRVTGRERLTLIVASEEEGKLYAQAVKT